MSTAAAGDPPAFLRRPHRPEVLLLAVALLLRLGWALAAPVDLWFDHIFNDVTGWNLSRGLGFTASLEPPLDPAIFRTPGYPAFLAGVYALLGHSVRAAFLVQAVVDVLSCALLGRLAERALGPTAGRWTLLLAATYPFTIHAVGTLSPETILVFAGLLFVALLTSLPERGGWAIVLAVGILHGALCWVKPVFLPLPAFLLLAERLRGRSWGISMARSALVGAVGLVLFLPWILRNQAAFGRPVLAGELGMVVWHGTRDFAEETPAEISGNFGKAPAAPADRWEATRRGFADSPALLGRDRIYLERGLAAVREHPVRAFLLDPLRRLPRLWISRSHVQLPAWVGWGASAAGMGYLLLGLFGLLRLRGRLGELSAWWVLPVTLTLAYAALHAEARYTLPGRPTLLLLGGVALAGFAARWGPPPPERTSA